MWKYSAWSVLVLTGILALPGRAPAEQIRFRYVPDGFGQTRQVAIGPDGSIGEKLTGIGLIPKPYRENFKPTHMVTFRHPYTGRNVTVPMTLTAGSQVTKIGTNHIMYNHGGIDVRFLPDGAVETVYKTGFLRP